MMNVEHIAHYFYNTDLFTISLEIDITNSIMGKGTFWCPPNIHKNIKIFSSLEKTQKIQQQEALFDTRIKLYEEYVSLHTQARKTH